MQPAEAHAIGRETVARSGAPYDHGAPSDEDLTVGLASVLHVPPGELTVTERRFNLYSTSAATEIVTCRSADGHEDVYLVKRESSGRGRDHGHRGGVAYEATVYREVLGPLGVRTPRFYGTFVDRTGVVSSVVAFLLDALRVNQDPDQDALVLAARWIGGFHRRSSVVLGNARRHVMRYDADYYAGWAGRALRFAGHGPHAGWIEPLCRSAPAALTSMLDEPVSVIHGEYYPSNVLFRGERIYPIDWETAAIARGEIDLAALTDAWPDPMTARCREAYVIARWWGSPPADFDRTLDLARLYLLLRWLGDRPEWTTDERAEGRYERLRAVGARLGLTEAPRG